MARRFSLASHRADRLLQDSADRADLVVGPQGGLRTLIRLSWRSAAAIAVVAALVAAANVGVQRWTQAVRESVPWVPAVEPYAVLVAPVPVTVTVEAAGQFAPWQTTEQELLASEAMWRRMHVGDWGAVPARLRRRAIATMLERYRAVLVTPHAWDAMDADEWDAIPQPVRVVAYRHMVAYWTGFYRVGAIYGLPPATVADTLTAILMSESWFEHRAVYRNRDGSRDIGLGQASDFARERLRWLYARGRVDVGPADRDYDDPWVASRVLAVWMSLMLDEAGGDLELAIGAYHRGIGRARDSAGAAYVAGVQRRLTRYIRVRDASSAWSDVWQIGRAIEYQEWPWLKSAGSSTRR